MVKLKVGDKFPEMEGETPEGPLSLSRLKGRNAVVYFYPKDGTPGCTREAKDFSELRGDFEKLDTEIVGVSTDTVEAHRRFIDKYDLDLNLVSDAGGTLCSACGVTGLTGRFAKRTTFLLDREGTIRHIWEKVDVKGHAEDVLAKISELKLGGTH